MQAGLKLPVPVCDMLIVLFVIARVAIVLSKQYKVGLRVTYVMTVFRAPVSLPRSTDLVRIYARNAEWLSISPNLAFPSTGRNAACGIVSH